MRKFLAFCICMLLAVSNLVTVFAENAADSESPIYYINYTSDEDFNEDNPDAYRIFKYENGKQVKISENAALQFAVVGDVIYYIKINDLMQTEYMEEGYGQIGHLWKVKKDGTEEELVSGSPYHTIVSDGEYLYFSGHQFEFGRNIMRMKPGESPEIFLEGQSTYSMEYSDGWLYFVSNNFDQNTGMFAGRDIRRVNVKTKEIEKITDLYPDTSNRLTFGVYEDYLIFSAESGNYKVNVTTKQEEKLPDFTDDGSEFAIKDVQDDMLLYYDWGTKQVEFLDMKSESFLDQDTTDENTAEFYFINYTSDNEFFRGYPNAYRIYKYDNGHVVQLSKNPAYQLAVVGDVIYYMKLDELEREDGYVQRGTLWQINKDGTDEKVVIDKPIYSIASDGEYLYFCGSVSNFGWNIMRMKPGESPEIFLDGQISARMKYSNGWLYYVDNYIDESIANLRATVDGYGVNKVNIQRKDLVEATRYCPNFYNGYAFYVYENKLIFDIDFEYYQFDMKTEQLESFPSFEDKGLRFGGINDIQGDILIYEDWETDHVGFFNLRSGKNLDILSIQEMTLIDTASEWAKPEILKAQEAGLVTPAVTMNFKNYIKRYQFAELVVNMVEKVTGKEIPPAAEDTFWDTKDISILKAYQAGIVNGTSENYFEPFALITREQIATMLYRAIQYIEKEKNKEYVEKNYSIDQYTDKEDVSDWAKEGVGVLANSGIMKGTSATTLSPQDNATIEQCITLINRLYNIVNQ